MKRRTFIAALGGAAVWPVVALAQQEPKVWRIGILEASSADQNAANLGAFQQSMRHLGYVEGQNLVIEYRSADGDAKRFPGLVAELIHLNVDLIVTRGTPAVLAAKEATRTIPIVMAHVYKEFPDRSRALARACTRHPSHSQFTA
jgi:putative ABC transport system substrate-binding protein